MDEMVFKMVKPNNNKNKPRINRRRGRDRKISCKDRKDEMKVLLILTVQ